MSARTRQRRRGLVVDGHGPRRREHDRLGGVLLPNVGLLSSTAAEVVFKGFLLLLAGIPIYVWLRWRRARAPTKAEPLTVEDLLPPIPDRQPVRR